MKLQLDTTNKTVKVEGSVNLEALFETLHKLLPQEEWKGFSLEANTTIEWTNPIVVPIYPRYPYNPYPWWNPTYPNIIYGTTGQGYTLNQGTYNIELTP